VKLSGRPKPGSSYRESFGREDSIVTTDISEDVTVSLVFMRCLKEQGKLEVGLHEVA
jgi:hypothetical protein